MQKNVKINLLAGFSVLPYLILNYIDRHSSSTQHVSFKGVANNISEIYPK